MPLIGRLRDRDADLLADGLPPRSASPPSRITRQRVVEDQVSGLAPVIADTDSGIVMLPQSLNRTSQLDVGAGFRLSKPAPVSIMQMQRRAGSGPPAGSPMIRRLPILCRARRVD